MLVRMPGLLQRLRDAFATSPRPIPDALWEQVVARVALVRERDASAQARLRDLAARFLARKRYSPVQASQAYAAPLSYVLHRRPPPSIYRGL